MLGKYKIKKQINGWRKIDMKYYCIKQHDITDCGAKMDGDNNGK